MIGIIGAMEEEVQALRHAMKIRKGQCSDLHADFSGSF